MSSGCSELTSSLLSLIHSATSGVNLSNEDHRLFYNFFLLWKQDLGVF